MQKVLAALLAATACAAQAEPVRAPSPSAAYAGVGVSGVDYVGAATKASPKVFAGYDVGKQLAVEGGAVDFKNGYGMYIAVKPSVPLTDKLSVYGKVGVAQTRRPVVLPIPAGKKSDTGAYGAFGLQYSITPNTALTAEYERYGKDQKRGAKPDVWTLALKFFF